jgi:hypothetical protein
VISNEPELSLPISQVFSDNGVMRCRVALILFACLVASTSFCRVPKSTSHPIDPAYSVALAAANRFLHAWQIQDHETGIMMLADGARQQTSPELLQSFFSPGPQAAYEIEHGKRIGRDEYSFPIVLFGSTASSARPHFCRIVVARFGKDDWVVEKLP